jgi:gamma-glutamyltranspeptidase/glutathione hydrolase/leukotriene-C4 hydrolase
MYNVMIFFSLGSTVMGRRTGFTFNDALNDFTDIYQYRLEGWTLPAGNRPKPNAKAAGMHAPTIITDEAGNVRLVTGASGGGKIILSVASVSNHCFGVLHLCSSVSSMGGQFVLNFLNAGTF